jgi:hypothetical protein
MPLTPSQIEHVSKYLEGKGVSQRCAECGGSEMIYADIVSLPFRGANLKDPSMHVVPIVCRKCAHARLFLAGPMGLIEGTI